MVICQKSMRHTSCHSFHSNHWTTLSICLIAKGPFRNQYVAYHSIGWRVLRTDSVHGPGGSSAIKLLWTRQIESVQYPWGANHQFHLPSSCCLLVMLGFPGTNWLTHGSNKMFPGILWLWKLRFWLTNTVRIFWLYLCSVVNPSYGQCWAPHVKTISLWLPTILSSCHLSSAYGRPRPVIADHVEVILLIRSSWKLSSIVRQIWS